MANGIDITNIEQANAALEKQANKLAQIKMMTGEIRTEAQAELAVHQQVVSELNKELQKIAEAKILYDEKKKAIEEEQERIKGSSEATTLANSLRLQELTKELEALNKNKDATEEQIEKVQDLRDAHVQAADAAMSAEEANKTQLDTMSQVLGAVTGIGDAWKQSAGGAFIVNARINGIGSSLANVGKAMKETFTMENIAGSFLTGMVQQTMALVMATDNARAAFAKATGQGAAYNDVISSVYHETRMLGIDTEEAQQAIQGLMNSMAGFGTMSKSIQADLAGFAATMQEIGVDSGTTGELLTNATKVMGMTGSESKQMAADLHGLSKALGVSFGKITGDFNSVMDDLAIYGKEAPKVFARLAGAAQETGVGIDKLVASMKELDTIEGAARRAGELNAALEGQFLGTHQLLNASYEERVALIQQAVADSGKEFNSLNRAEKQLIAQAAGFDNVADAAKVFGNTSTEALASAMAAAEGASGSLGKMQGAAKGAQSMSDKLKAALSNLAVAVEPLLSVLHFMVETLGLLLSIPGAPYIFGFAAAFVLLVGVMTKVRGAIATAKNGFKSVGDVANKSGGGISKSIKSVGQAAAGSAKGLLALGASALMIGGAVAIAALGVAELVKSFSGFSSGEILAIAVALAVFGATMVILALVLAKMSPVLAVAGTGLLVFGLAVAIVAAGVYIMAKAFGVFVEEGVLPLMPHVGSLIELAAGLMLMALAGLLLLPAGLAAAIGLAAMGLGFALLGAGLFLVSNDDLREIGVIFTALGKIAENGATGITSLVPAIESIVDSLTDGDAILRLAIMTAAIRGLVDAISDLDGTRASQFTVVMREVFEASQAAKGLTPDMVDNVENLVEVADDYSSIKYSLFGGDGEAQKDFADMLKSALGTGGGRTRTGTAAPSSRGTTVVLELDGKELGRTVENLLSRRNKLRTIT